MPAKPTSKSLLRESLPHYVTIESTIESTSSGHDVGVQPGLLPRFGRFKGQVCGDESGAGEGLGTRLVLPCNHRFILQPLPLPSELQATDTVLWDGTIMYPLRLQLEQLKLLQGLRTFLSSLDKGSLSKEEYPYIPIYVEIYSPNGCVVYAGGSLCKSSVQAGYRIGYGFAWSTGVSGLCLQSHLLALSLLLVVAGDVERNPGPLSDEFLANVDSTELTEDDVLDVYRAVLNLAGKWRDMCFVLGLKSPDEELIATTYPQEPKRCLREVMIKWLRKAYDVNKHGPPTWRTLVKAVSDKAGGDNPALAEVIANEHKAKQCEDASCSSNSCLAYVLKYADYLKKKYLRLPIFPGGSEWPPSVGEHDTQVALIKHEEYPQNSCAATEDMNDIIVGRVDRILGRKQEISIQEIFAPSATTGSELKVLIDGAPGVGKTTLTRRFVKDWAEGKLLSEYDFVLLLPLRDRKIAQASCINELFYHDDPELREQIACHVCKTMGAKVMLIFDGFDELSLSQRKEGSLLLDILCGEKLLHCSVIVTSRPYASEAMQRLQCLSRHVEVLGFTEQQIEHCITNSIPDTEKAQALIQQLWERQDLISLCYVPLNCAIMVFVYKHKSYTLPDTITQLYEAFLINTLQRHIDKYEGLGKRVRSLNRLPDSQLQAPACLQALSKLAFKGLDNDQSTFYIEELEAELSRITPEGYVHSKLLGIMNVFHSTSGIGIEESYQFLHRTVQEFLAARYASELPVNDQMSFFKKQVANFDTVVVFLAGLTKLADPAYQQYFESEVSISLQESDVFLQYLHSIYEAQNIELCQILPKCVENQEISMTGVHLSPFYCRVLTYCLVNSGCCWKSLDLHKCRLSDCCLEAIKNVQTVGTSGSIKELIFSPDESAHVHGYSTKDNVFTFAGLSLLPNIPLFQHVEVLKLSSYSIKPVNGLDKFVDGFAKLLQMKKLVSLSFNTLRINYLRMHKAFSTALQYTKKDFERHLVPCKLLECPTQISPSLQTLNLTMPEMSDSDEIKCIANSLVESSVTSLQLHLQNYSVSYAGISDMFPSLLSMRAIETLSLHLCRSHSSPILLTSDATVTSSDQRQPFVVLTELEGLQQMLETSGTLKTLELSIDGIITEVDVQYLANGLSVNQPLTSLTLSSVGRQLVFGELSPIYKALQHKKNLEKLFICANHYDPTDPTTESGLSELREALKSNLSLWILSLNGVGSNEIKYIADGLIDHPSLESIFLLDGIYSVMNTQIPHVSHLLKVLHSCPALHLIFISSGLTACCSWVQDDTTNGHWDVQHDTGSELEAGDLIGASLLQERWLILNFFSHSHQGPFVVDPTWLPNTRQIVEGLCKNLVAHYPILKNCGFALLHFCNHYIFALFEFEPVQGAETGGLDSTLLPMGWESMDRVASFETIRAFQEAKRLEEGDSHGELQQWTAYIGVRISMENKVVDLLLKVVEGVCWTQHLEPGDVFTPIKDGPTHIKFASSQLENDILNMLYPPHTRSLLVE